MCTYPGDYGVHVVGNFRFAECFAIAGNLQQLVHEDPRLVGGGLVLFLSKISNRIIVVVVVRKVLPSLGYQLEERNIDQII